jgi:hypothetical protein
MKIILICLIVIFVCLVIFSLVALGAFARGSGAKGMNAQQLAQRAVDLHKINNLMSLHAWYHAALMHDVEIEEIWSKRDDIVLWFQQAGYFKGPKMIKEAYGKKVGRESTKGFFTWHTITTPVVEVAADGKTAKGIWYTPGVVGFFQNGESNFNWMFEKYGVDFIHEDGVWKIWHMHVYTDAGWSLGETISADGSMGGVPAVLKAIGSLGTPASQDGSTISETTDASAPMKGPDADGQGYKTLSPTTELTLRPRPPVPYKTWSETWSYVDPGE